MADADDLDVFDVVVICSGNRFRSPIAEAVLRDATRGLPVRVGSAGTLDLASGPAFPEALEIGRSYGLDLAQHRSRPVADVDLSGADLVIGFEPIHVATAVTEGHAPRERAFLLTELADLLGRLEPRQAEGPVGRARHAIQAAHEERLASTLRAPEEIADPVGGPYARFAATAEQVRERTLAVARALFP